MEGDTSTLGIQISEVFSTTEEQFGSISVEEINEDVLDNTAILLEELEDDDVYDEETDDIFEENCLIQHLENDQINTLQFTSELYDVEPLSPNGNMDPNIEAERDESININKVISRSIESFAPMCLKVTNSSFNYLEKNNDEDDCVLISDDDEAQIIKTKEIITSEFDSTDDIICIGDDEQTEDDKTVDQKTDDDYCCIMQCNFRANEVSLMKHEVKHLADVDLSNTKQHKSGLNFNCSQCDYKTDKRIHLTKHISKEHSSWLRCNECSYKSKYKYKIISHQCLKTKKSYKCKFDPCPFKTKSAENLKTHEWIQHQIGSNQIKNYKCPVQDCYFESYRKDSFEEHVKLHSDRGLLQCKICINYKTYYFYKFQQHLKLHMDTS